MNQVKAGAVLNYIIIVLTTAVGLFLTPFIILKLGDSEFGLYSLIGAFVGYLSILDFGLSNTVVRFVANRRAKNDRIGEESFLATAMLMYLTISFLVLIIGSVLYLNLDGFFGDSLSSSELKSAKVMFLILICSLAFNLPGGMFEGICYGYEHFVYPKAVKIVLYIVRTISIVAVLHLGGDAVSIVVVDALLNVCAVFLNVFYIFLRLKVRFIQHGRYNDLFKEIFSYSIWIFVFILVGQLQWKVGQLVLGVHTNTVTVAIFAVGVMLGTLYGSFSSAISSIMLPRASFMIARNATEDEQTDMMIKIGRLSFVVLMYILGGFLLYGMQFVNLWVGESYHQSWIIALLIMVAYTAPLVLGFGNSILEARKKVAFKATCYLICLIIGTGIGGAWAKSYGAIGMISGSLLGWIMAQLIMNIYYHKVIGLNILRFYVELIRKILPAFLVVLVAGYAINQIPGNGWLNFIIKGLSYTAVYSTLMFSFGLKEDERRLFAEPFRFVFRRRL